MGVGRAGGNGEAVGTTAVAGRIAAGREVADGNVRTLSTGRVKGIGEDGS